MPSWRQTRVVVPYFDCLLSCRLLQEKHEIEISQLYCLTKWRPPGWTAPTSGSPPFVYTLTSRNVKVTCTAILSGKFVRVYGLARWASLRSHPYSELFLNPVQMFLDIPFLLMLLISGMFYHPILCNHHHLLVNAFRSKLFNL